MAQITRRHKKDTQKDKHQAKESNPDKDKDKSDDAVKPKFGPALKITHHRLWSRCVLIVGVLIIVWYNNKNSKESPFAKQKDVLLSRSQNLECSQELRTDLTQFPECMPEKCGRVVTDKLVSDTEAEILLKVAKNVFKLGGSDGGASILDLYSGAFSKGTGFVDIFQLEDAAKYLNSADYAIYKVVKTKIQHAIAHHFQVNADQLYLTKPTFFSRMTNVKPKTIHDEYWHPHVDSNSYESFHFTSLLYLNDYEKDFQGGRFIFVDKNTNATIEPRKGRVSMFTSGSENVHAVEKVTSGTRYALTVPFTCDPRFAIPDPSFRRTSKKT